MQPMQRLDEGLKVGLGMEEVWLGAVLAVCVGCVAFLAYRMEKNANALRHELALSVAKLDSKTFPEIPDFNEMREGLEDLIEETIGSMRVPQAADHIMAMAQQWFQIKMAKQMEGFQMPTEPQLEAPPLDSFESHP